MLYVYDAEVVEHGERFVMTFVIENASRDEAFGKIHRYILSTTNIQLVEVRERKLAIKLD
jgi:hypothetical protein